MIATAKILDIEIGFFSLFGIMAASLLASRLPISVAGWGVREGVLVSFLSAYGVIAEKAFATSVIYGLTELSRGHAGASDRFCCAPFSSFSKTIIIRTPMIRMSGWGRGLSF